MSGAGNYQELCMASKNEEKRLADLKKRPEYSKLQTSATSSAQHQSGRPRESIGHTNNHPRRNSVGSSPSTIANASKPNNRCFHCGKPGQDCRRRRREVGDSESHGPSHSATMKQIRAGEDSCNQSTPNTASHTSNNSSQLTTSVPASPLSRIPVVDEDNEADTPG